MPWFNFLTILIVSCGIKPSSRPPPPDPVLVKDEPNERPPEPKVEPPEPDLEPEITFQNTIVGIVRSDCALSGCHAGSPMFESEEAFLRSTSIRRIENDSMPPTLSPRYNQWTVDKKDLILEWYRLKQ